MDCFLDPADSPFCDIMLLFFKVRWKKENDGVIGSKHSRNLPGRNFLGGIVLMCFVVSLVFT